MTGYSLSAAFTAEDLNAMTVAEIKSLSNDMGYTITGTRKADFIAEFLTQQEGK